MTLPRLLLLPRLPAALALLQRAQPQEGPHRLWPPLWLLHHLVRLHSSSPTSRRDQAFSGPI